MHKYNSNYPLYHHGLPSTTVCEESNDNCWFNKCDTCKDGKLFKINNPIPNDFKTDSDISNSESDADPDYCYIKWMQWEKITGMDGKERLEKVKKTGLPSDIYNCIVSSLPTFNLHHYIKGCQSKHYNQMKTELPSKNNTAMMQIDFAENFSTFWQDEIQSAHWKKTQVTVFTCVYWHNDECKSPVVVSDDLDHSKESIIVFIDHLIAEIVDAEVNILNIWSDGPSSQFKNRFIAAAIKWFSNKYGIELIWNFFATSHGKGPVDAIGGTVKRQVSSCIIQRRAIVKDSESFYHCALEACSTIRVFIIPAVQIKQTVDLQLLDLIANAPPLPGISNTHQFSIRYGQIELKYYSTCLTTINTITTPDQMVNKDIYPNAGTTITCGTFIVVNYDFTGSSSGSLVSRRLAAVVNRVEETDLYVSYCKALTKRRFKVNSNDEGVVKENDVIQLLGCPNLRRGVYEFDEDVNIDTL